MNQFAIDLSQPITPTQSHLQNNQLPENTRDAFSWHFHYQVSLGVFQPILGTSLRSLQAVFFSEKLHFFGENTRNTNKDESALKKTYFVAHGT